MTHVAYLVPDLTDPAVARRRAMLQAGGAHVRTAGFHRRPMDRSDENVVPLGMTRDADLGQRLRAVGRWLLRPFALRRLVRGSRIVIARNLEMLVLARVALIGRAAIPLHYECLDIHRLMLGQGVVSRGLRAVEALLLRRVSRVIVSSPAFERQYFKVHHAGRSRCLLVENRLLALDDAMIPTGAITAPEPPWVIGWFGMIRCRRSLAILAALAEAAHGRIRVVIRGRPTTAVFADLAAEVARLPGVSFEGGYTSQDLPRLYSEVHFVWAIDFYEEGLNSAWLLPNRLYEGGAFDRPVIALRGVETARWLQARQAGLVVTDPEPQLGAALQTLTAERYAELTAAARAIPRSDLICDRDACVVFLNQLNERGP